MNEIIKAMEERRSIRKFKADMPAKEEFEMEEWKKFLADVGVEGEWEGIGHLAVGYVDGEIPKAAERKEGRVFWVE
ncbi:MAG: hypothetical protein NC412_08525 [Roseburia sp.]|nr:hypothetical protein [Roseburia sp.]MCM1279477.1 hypothetical protein [Robinsoniella sp.]